jgi:hypothetical protein
MKRAIALLLLVLFAIACAGTQELLYAYRVFTISPVELQKVLTSQGLEGFRVVSLTFTQGYCVLVMEKQFFGEIIE